MEIILKKKNSMIVFYREILIVEQTLFVKDTNSPKWQEWQSLNVKWRIFFTMAHTHTYIHMRAINVRPLLAFSTLQHARICTGNNRDGQGELILNNQLCEEKKKWLRCLWMKRRKPWISDYRTLCKHHFGAEITNNNVSSVDRQKPLP